MIIFYHLFKVFINTFSLGGVLSCTRAVALVAPPIGDALALRATPRSRRKEKLGREADVRNKREEGVLVLRGNNSTMTILS